MLLSIYLLIRRVILVGEAWLPDPCALFLDVAIALALLSVISLLAFFLSLALGFHFSYPCSNGLGLPP